MSDHEVEELQQASENGVDNQLEPLVNSLRLLGASGLYRSRPQPIHWPLPIPLPLPVPERIPGPLPQPGPIGRAEHRELQGDLESEIASVVDDPGAENAVSFWPFQAVTEDLRLDVDGRYPQMTASGTIRIGLFVRVHWIASLRRAGRNQWAGRIWHKDGSTSSLPQTSVSIRANRSWFPNQRRATIEFSGGGAPVRTATLAFASSYFHDVHFEYDSVLGATAATSVNTDAHPNRPAGLPAETLTIEKVYQRAGFQVARSGDSNVPLALAHADARWSDAEMHDAMQMHWSKFVNKPQWALWTFFASLHEMGPDLGGIMFDDIGPQHRQGTAIFSDAFIKDAPLGDPAPAAWVQRMRFWTACHEMGHAFNLAHSWQKALGSPWLPLANEPEARSFMNYPYRVAGGEAAFFADFDYRFSDMELLFLRHGPERFVEMGNADWFDDHGFERIASRSPTGLRLQATVNRADRAFDFLEPIVIELRLENVSGTPQIVDRDVLSGDHGMLVVLQKQGGAARQWLPYARYLRREQQIVLAPGETLYGSLFVSAGRNGWDIAEPGRYQVQVAIRQGDAHLASAPLALRILPAQSRHEERLAQDMFCDEVGRTLAFDGSRFFEGANATLRDIAEQLPDRPVSQHARVALAMPAMRDYKLIDYDAARPCVRTSETKIGDVDRQFEALLSRPEQAAVSLGHIDFKHYLDRYSDFLARKGKVVEAAKCQRELRTVLAARRVLPSVLAAIDRRVAELQDAKKSRKKGEAIEAVG